MIKKKLIQQFVVEPCEKVDLKRYLTDWTETDEAKELGKGAIKELDLKYPKVTLAKLAELDIAHALTHS